MLELTNKRITMQDSKYIHIYIHIYIYIYIYLCIHSAQVYIYWKYNFSEYVYVTNKEKHCLRSNKLHIDLTSTVLYWYIRELNTSRENPISDLLESFQGQKWRHAVL